MLPAGQSNYVALHIRSSPIQKTMLLRWSSSLLVGTLLFISSRASELSHSSKDLVEVLRRQATICPYAHPQWLSLRHTSLSYFLPHPPQGRLLMITISLRVNLRASLTKLHRAKTHYTTLVAVFGEHPREQVTIELALKILMRYCRTPPSRAAFVLIPIANPRTDHQVDGEVSCQRLNHRSVDLNRNYAYSWGHTDHDTVPEEERPGMRPLSEFETSAIDGLVRRIRPTAYISVHSGDTAILVPFDSGEPVGGWIRNVANVVRRNHCPLCRVGSAKTIFGYRAYGTGVDHMFGLRQVPFACTLEIYGGPQSDCWLMFNPNNRSALLQVLENWTGVLETIADEMTDQSAASWTWYKSLLPRGYLVSVVADGDLDDPVPAIPAQTMVIVVMMSVAAIAIRQGLKSLSQSIAVHMTSKWSAALRSRRRYVSVSRVIV